MTLVQASIANAGNSVVLIADRLLTSRLGEDVPSYEFEWNKPKIMSIGNIGIGFSGAALHADMVEREISDLDDLDEVIEKISKFIVNQKEEYIEKYIKHYAGVPAKDFFTDPQLPIPLEVRGLIYGFIAEFDLMFQCVVCGFDKNNNVRLAAIDAEGNCFELANFGMVSIGSGQPFSKIYFDLYSYVTNVSETDGLFFSYKAKKWAEAPTGVGTKTDILIIRKEGSSRLIQDESPLMKEIESTYNEELKNREKVRTTLIKDLDEKLKLGTNESKILLSK